MMKTRQVYLPVIGALPYTVSFRRRQPIRAGCAQAIDQEQPGSSALSPSIYD